MKGSDLLGDKMDIEKSSSSSNNN